MEQCLPVHCQLYECWKPSSVGLILKWGTDRFAELSNRVTKCDTFGDHIHITEPVPLLEKTRN